MVSRTDGCALHPTTEPHPIRIRDEGGHSEGTQRILRDWPR